MLEKLLSETMRKLIMLQSSIIFSSILLLFLSDISIAVDTITPNQTLRDGERLVSSRGTFELGFFSPGNSKNRYVGIWYKQITNQTVVWVANRDNPLTNSSGILRIGDKGNLILVNKSAGSVIWSSNQSKADNPVAQILDTGNLVIREANDENPNNYLWQSFDHPTDTLLPGMKLGWNLKTGMNRYLTSWKSEDDPSTGVYSFRIEAHGFPEAFLWNQRHKQFRTGPWNGLRFGGIPQMKPNYIFNFNFTSNQEEVYYSFSLKNESLVSRFMVNQTGQLQRTTWLETSRAWNIFWYLPKDQCDNYNVCGAYGICDINASPVCKCIKGFEPKKPEDWYFRVWSGGCIKKSELDCHKGYGFLRLKEMKLPETSRSFADNSMSLKDCEVLCRNNCACTAYANSDVTGGGTGCVIWTTALMDLRQFTENGDGQDVYVRVAASDLDSYKNKRVMVIVIVTVCVAVLLFGLSVCFIRKRKTMLSIWKRNIEERDTEERGIKEKSQDPLLFDVAIQGTRNYSDENKKDDLEFGYMSPEYAMDGLFSVKSDVFSFGVLVLEIISGKKNKGFYSPDNQLNLLGHVWRLWREGKAVRLLDSSMADSFPTHDVLRCIQVGLLCVQERAEDRPTISSVILMLSSENAILPIPKKPGFCLGTIPIETESSSSKQESCTVNQVTVTILEAR
ncbi:hypothetical protein HHK36_013170 [Tetracentron sinense]|uniref:non-specific serine/threonine protein kinase n=1 Tax=Tetracentron sinense TaxID=13715 RepID=A0A834ZBR4_TETSI|nr:hypothetical protein HHK36_013170 [Tetracentron sinense]